MGKTQQDHQAEYGLLNGAVQLFGPKKAGQLPEKLETSALDEPLLERFTPPSPFMPIPPLAAVASPTLMAGRKR